MCKIILLMTVLMALSDMCQPVNHWVLSGERIVHKIDSPFYMREPDNLIVFLDQIRYNDYVEKSYLQLLRQREQIVEHLRFSVQFGEDLVEQAKCAMEYYLMEKRMSYLKMSSAYLDRLDITDRSSTKGQASLDEPICGQMLELSPGPSCYDHLESLRAIHVDTMRIDPEDEINVGEVGTAMKIIRQLSFDGLKKEPRSWKFHTLASYYWRMRGQAKQALECARLGVMLAPRVLKDIPLLSMGTILFRAGRLLDADIILTAAVEHAPHIPENHIALGSALAMKHDFNRSLYHFDEAERLDPSLLPRTLPVRNFITCLENLTKKTTKMYSYVEYMKNEVNAFKKLKYRISQNHEKLIQQQVPLGARHLGLQISSDDLHKRGQYCSTRTLSSRDEPVLFCDFFSDMQMRLQSKDVDIESLERDLKLTSEAVMRQVSAEFRKQLNFEQGRESATTSEINESGSDSKKEK